MNYFEKFELSNGIKILYKHTPGTPRAAIHLFLSGGNTMETSPGINTLLTRLLLKGTEKRNAEELANELDYYGISLDADSKSDYIKIKTVFLNEDYAKALELLADILLHSTFNETEKEKKITLGELQMELESPKAKAFDNLLKNLYLGHPYGVTSSVLLEKLETINQQQIQEMMHQQLGSQNIVIAVVGDLDKKNVQQELENYLNPIPNTKITAPTNLTLQPLHQNSLLTIVKDDAAQAQILQSWFAPPLGHDDHAALVLANTILGSGGLSTRLFIELREKKGLAYSVHSLYEPYKYSGYFAVYIGTNPDNIDTCMKAFDQEIKKLQNVPITETELQEAKTKVLGKRAIYHETNSQIAHYLGYYELMGFGAEYDIILPDKLQQVTSQDIQKVSCDYLSQHALTSIVAPQKHLETVCV